MRPIAADGFSMKAIFFVIYPLIELPSPRLRKFKDCEFVEKWKTLLKDSIITHIAISFQFNKSINLKLFTKLNSHNSNEKEFVQIVILVFLGQYYFCRPHQLINLISFLDDK